MANAWGYGHNDEACQQDAGSAGTGPRNAKGKNSIAGDEEEDQDGDDVASSGSEDNIPFLKSPSESSKAGSEDDQDTQSEDTESDAAEYAKETVTRKGTNKEEKQEQIETCLKLANQASTSLLFLDKDHREVRKQIVIVSMMATEIGCGRKVNRKRNKEGMKVDRARAKACDLAIRILQSIKDRIWCQSRGSEKEVNGSKGKANGTRKRSSKDERQEQPSHDAQQEPKTNTMVSGKESNWPPLSSP